MDPPHDGRTALITGGSSGIGRTSAEALARDGADLVLVSRRVDPLEETAASIRETSDVEVVTCSADVSDEEEIDQAIETAVESYESLDIVVNNAGVIRGLDVDIESFETEDYATMMATNVDGAFFTTRAVLPHLMESGGNLIFIGSLAGCYPRPYNPVYAASKWWIRGFAHSVEASVGSNDVGVSVINPSAVRTKLGAKEGQSWRERFSRDEASRPEEVAEAVTYAARYSHSTVSEINMHTRGKLGDL